MTLPFRKIYCALLLTIVLSLVTTCASIKHVVEYNEARKLFNDTTQKANEISYRPVSPLDQDLQVKNGKPEWDRYVSLQKSGLTAGLTANEAMELLTNYALVRRKLKAINEESTKDLIEDNLYASSLVLALMAEWKHAFYSQYYGLVEPSVKDVDVESTGKKSLDLAESEPLSNIRARATRIDNVLKEKKITVFPRDQFVLKAIDPLIRYDNAYLYAFQYNRDGKFSHSVPRDSRVKDVKSIVEAMANAEKILAELEIPNLSHADDYQSMARIAMLWTAANVVLDSAINIKKEGLWSDKEAKDTIPALVGRLDQAKKEAANPNSKLGRFISKFQLKPNEVFRSLY